MAKQLFPLILKGCLGFLLDHTSLLARFSTKLLKNPQEFKRMINQCSFVINMANKAQPELKLEKYNHEKLLKKVIFE